MEDLNVAIRLKGFIDAEGLTHSQFADRCGIPRPSLSQILSGRNKKISDVIVGQIHQAFPELSVLWLLFGEGPMMTKGPGDDEQGAAGVDSADRTLDFPSDAGKIPSSQSANMKYQNVSGLTGASGGGQTVENKNNDIDMRILDLQRQIDKMRRNPRKVSHITVYYDDSTFETFYPKR